MALTVSLHHVFEHTRMDNQANNKFCAVFNFKVRQGVVSGEN